MSRRVRFAGIHVVTVVAMCLVGLVGGPTLRGQDGVTVSGSVVDAPGLALPGVTVELRTGEEAFVTLAITDRTGWGSNGSSDRSVPSGTRATSSSGSRWAGSRRR